MHFGSADAAGGGPRFTRTPRYSALCLVFPGDPDHVANAAFRRSRVRWQEPQQVRCLPETPNCWKSLAQILRPSVRNTGFLALSCAPAPFQRQGLPSSAQTPPSNPHAFAAAGPPDPSVTESGPGSPQSGRRAVSIRDMRAGSWPVRWSRVRNPSPALGGAFRLGRTHIGHPRNL